MASGSKLRIDENPVFVEEVRVEVVVVNEVFRNVASWICGECSCVLRRNDVIRCQGEATWIGGEWMLLLRVSRCVVGSVVQQSRNTGLWKGPIEGYGGRRA